VDGCYRISGRLAPDQVDESRRNMHASLLAGHVTEDGQIDLTCAYPSPQRIPGFRCFSRSAICRETATSQDNRLSSVLILP
jgi:hypothetical protein